MKPQGISPDGALGKTERAGRDDDSARHCHLFHARRQVRSLAHCGVVHVEVATDRTHHHLTGVESHPDTYCQTLGLLGLISPSIDAILHSQCRIAGAHRVILKSNRSAEQSHDAIAHELIDRALIAVNGLHHPLKYRVKKLARFFRVAIGQQLHRALQIGEQDSHLLALAFEGVLRCQDAPRQMLRRVKVGGSKAIGRVR